MLIKSIKHDLMATYRDFFAIYLALLVAAIIGPFIIQSGQQWIISILILLIFGLVIAIVVVTFITIVRLYYQRLFSAEGYLTLTLPVKTHTTIIAKILTGLIWSLCTIVVFTISGTIFTVIFYFLNESLHFIDMAQILTIVNLVMKTNTFVTLIQSMLIQAPYGFIQSIYSLTLLLFVITFVNTSFIKKGKLAIGVAIYLVLGNLISLALSVTHGAPIEFIGSMMNQTTGNFVDDLSYTFNAGNYAIQIAGIIVVIAILGYATWWLLEHKLEIE